MDRRFPPLKIKIMLESKPLNSRISVRRVAVQSQEKTYSYHPPSLVQLQRAGGGHDLLLPTRPSQLANENRIRAAYVQCA